MEDGRDRKIVCPRCGKALPLRIIELEGKIKLSLICKNCKQRSEITIGK